MRLKEVQGKARSRVTIQVLNVQQAPRPPLQKPPEQRPSRVPGHKSIARAAQLTLEDRLALVQGLNLSKPERHAQPRSDGPVSIEHDVLDDSVYIPTTTRTPPEPTIVQETDSVYVFSYGSNLSWETMNKKDVHVLSRDPAFVCDPSIRLVFKHRGGHASLEKLPAGVRPKFKPYGVSGGPCVHGVLYRVPQSSLKHVQAKDHGYIMTTMQVETYDGLQTEAKVFVSGPLNKLPEEVTPPEAYMRKLREGAAFNFLAPQYQAWLSSIETVPSAGLPAEYFNTPSRLGCSSLLTRLLPLDQRPSSCRSVDLDVDQQQLQLLLGVRRLIGSFNHADRSHLCRETCLNVLLCHDKPAFRLKAAVANKYIVALSWPGM